MSDIGELFQGFMALGAVGTAAAGFVIYKAIQENTQKVEANNDWNRKHSTIDMIKEWNDHARAHIKFLRNRYPELSGFSWRASEEELEKIEFNSELAELVYAGDSDETRDVRDRLISLFNYFEYVSTAYEHEIVDRQAIEVSFRGVILNTYVYFNAFVQVMRKQRKYEPWLPLALLVSKWTTTE
jgi:hypothetical protein